MEKTRLEIGNIQNIILILGNLYSPTDAASEFFANSMDAHSKNIEISFGKDTKGSFVVFSDDGDGMNEVDLRRVAKNIGNSIKKIQDNSYVGQFGIGILGFVTFGDEMHIISRKKSLAPLSELIIRKGDIDCIIETSKRKNLRISKEHGTDVYVYYRGKSHLLGHHLANHITEKYRHLLLRNPINASVKAGRKKEYEIKAFSLSGVLINKQRFNTPYGPLKFDIYLSGSEANDYPLKIIRKGVVICNLTDIDEFKRSPWNNKKLTGEIIFDSIHITSDRKQILLNNAQYESFKEKILLIEESIDSYLKAQKKEKFESLNVEFKRYLNDLIQQALTMLKDPIDIFERKTPSSEKYINPIIDIPDPKEIGFQTIEQGLKISENLGKGEEKQKLSAVVSPSLSTETRLEDFDIKDIDNPLNIYKPKKRPGINWEFDSEYFQDEPWKLSKYDPSLNSIYINDSHPYWQNIKNLTNEKLKNILKEEYIVALTIKEIIIYNLRQESNPFLIQIDKNMESFIRFRIKIEELEQLRNI